MAKAGTSTPVPNRDLIEGILIEWTRVPAQSVMNRLSGRLNHLVIVGEELCESSY